MSSVGKRVAVPHLLGRGHRRRITAAGFTALASVTFAAPLTFSTRAGASTDEPTTTTTEQSVPITTGTVATTTIAVPTTTDTIVLPATTSTIAENTTTTAPVVVGGEGVVELGRDQTPVTLTLSPGSAIAAQLPQTGATPTLPTLTGIALLIAGALASGTKRRRNMGMIPIRSRSRRRS
jgi:LPXTG-motif cell wall-anchored protein